MNKGKFIVFEGTDGSGKSTHARILTEKLMASGIDTYVTFEPTSYETGKLLRRFLSGEISGDERTVAALFMADRMEHLFDPEDGIIAHLEKGITVICDRYYLSSVAYNCHSENIDWVLSINARAKQTLMPDLTIFLDAPIERTEKRTANRVAKEIYEKNDVQQRVRERYYEAFAKLTDENIAIISTDRERQLVSDDIWQKAQELFN
ncbi:MAG: dTMP kinase [Clostridia bacterium]|nr:dTMP kinase [Clostridia bacterium]